MLDYRNDVSDRQSPQYYEPRKHVQALSRRLVELLGADYAINLDKPPTKGDKAYWTTRCIYYTHNEKHYDNNPSAWIGVTAQGKVKSGCWRCERSQVVDTKDTGVVTPYGFVDVAPTLLTLSRNDRKLADVLVWMGCREVEKGEMGPAVVFPVTYVEKGEMRPAVVFPVTYADGTTGYHYRVALEGKNKWFHLPGGKASQAVFGLHMEKVLEVIQKTRMVIVTESPVDAAVLLAAGFPAIAVLGKNYARALAYNLHKETLLKAIGDTGTVYVWQEPDAADFAQQVANALRFPVKVITPPEEGKDAYRLWVAREKDWDVMKDIVWKLLERATEIAPQPEPAPHATPAEYPRHIIQRLGDITVQDVEWLVKEYIPIGAVTLLAGDGGHGKTTVLCDLAASILKGEKWLRKFDVAQGGVILIVTEHPEEMKRRLVRYRIADDDPVVFVNVTLLDEYEPLNVAHALPEILRGAKKVLGDTPIRLIGLDCLRGFGFDEKQASRQKGSRLPTIRDIYTPLTHFAQQEGAAVIVTHHFRKMLAEERRHLSPKRKKGKDVAPDIDIHTLRNLIAGTADIVNAARHALVLVSDLEAGIGTLVPVKSNRSQVLGAPIRYDWHTDTPTFLSFLDEDDTAMEKAFAFFRRVLAEGALPSDEVKAQAKKEGISERTLWRAKERMGVKAEKQLLHGKAVWMWFLPHHPDLHPEGCEEAEGDPSCNIDPEGGTTGPALHPDRDTDEDPRIPENLAELAEYNGKPMENIALSTLPHKNGLWQSWQRPETVRVCQVCQTENTLAETLAETQVPVKSSTYNHLCQDCQGFDVSEAAHPEGDHSCNIEPGSPERMSRIEPGGRVVLSWDGKTETVSPTDLAGWRPIEEIPEVPLPNMESVEIPPVVVVDIETTGLDWERDRLLAVGVALYRDGREVDAKIFSSESGEAALLAHTFESLRDVTKRVGEIILTGYNVADFDLPFLVWRAHVLRVECPFRFLRDREGHITKWRVAATAGTLRSDPLEYPALRTDLPISVVDTLHLVCRWDYTAKALRHYNLKSVAAHFGVHQPDRPVLSPAQIQHAFKHDPETFEAYLLADLRETYALFAKLIPPYAAIAAITELPLDQVVTRSTAWMWEQILKRHYGVTQQPDEKVDYEGGLVVSRKGVWSPCLKLDVASLYPTIMLAYRIHSRKDPDQVALRWLKTLTEQRLALKAKAKKGDERAHILQDAMKILINSLYGFYGTGGYGFNDMSAAEKVTEKGRKILTSMIAAVEEAGGIIVEADTDGIIVCTRHTDPQALVHAVTAAIPEVFTVEVEWQDAICFVSDDKNYIVLPQDGDPITKGSKWRGRDKEAYLTQAIPTFVRLWATEGEDAAMRFANTVEDEIRGGHGWRWVVRAHRVGKNDKFLLQAGFRVGEYATYAYKEKTKGAIARDPHEGYDREYYARKFVETVREVLAAIRATESPSDNDCHKAILSDGPTII